MNRRNFLGLALSAPVFGASAIKGALVKTPSVTAAGVINLVDGEYVVSAPPTLGSMPSEYGRYIRYVIESDDGEFESGVATFDDHNTLRRGETFNAGRVG